MKTFKEFLNESLLATRLPKDPPPKAEGYYVINKQGEEAYKFELNQKGFKIAKATAKDNDMQVVAASLSYATNKIRWALVHTDGGLDT